MGDKQTPISPSRRLHPVLNPQARVVAKISLVVGDQHRPCGDGVRGDQAVECGAAAVAHGGAQNSCAPAGLCKLCRRTTGRSDGELPVSIIGQRR